MRKLIWSNPMSLDGFVEGPNGLDWMIADAELHEYSAAQLRAAGAILFGRVTYQLMVDYWPRAAQDPAAEPAMLDFASAINDPQLQKFVFSKTLEHVDWNAQLIREIDPAQIRAWKAQPGKDLAIGGASLGSALAQLGLVDEYELLVQPVALGSGKPMFHDLAQPLRMTFLSSVTFASGVLALRYAAA